VGAGLVCGCGGPPGAGTVNMTAIKQAAEQRGIPESKTPTVSKTGVNQPGGRTRGTVPTKPIPKGGR
jgi:hypothetical protein